MAAPPEDVSLDQRVRVMQIIVAAMALGIVSFMGITIFIRLSQQQAPPEMPVLTYIALGYTPIALVLQAILPGMMAAARSQTPERLEGLAGKGDEVPDVGSLCATYQTLLIISMAIIEGAAFLALIAYLVDGNVLTLGAALVLLAVLLAKFPTVSRVERWIEERREAMKLGG